MSLVAETFYRLTDGAFCSTMRPAYNPRIEKESLMKSFNSFLRKVLKMQDGEDLVWYLLRVQRPWYWQVCGISGFFAIFFFGFGMNYLMAAAMLISMYSHEIGHGIVFSMYKIKWVLRMLFPLGAVAAPATKEEDKKSDRVHWWGIAVLSNAGIFANLVLLAFGSLLRTFPQNYVSQMGAALATVNSFLIFLNILPVWKLDGKLFWSTIFSSLDEQEDKIVGGSIIVAGVLATFFVVLVPGSARWQTYVQRMINNFGWWLIPMVIAVGVWQMQYHNKAEYFKSKLAMNHVQISVQITYYLAILLATIVLTFGVVKTF